MRSHGTRGGRAKSPKRQDSLLAGVTLSWPCSGRDTPGMGGLSLNCKVPGAKNTDKKNKTRKRLEEVEKNSILLKITVTANSWILCARHYQSLVIWVTSCSHHLSCLLWLWLEISWTAENLGWLCFLKSVIIWLHF